MPSVTSGSVIDLEVVCEQCPEYSEQYLSQVSLSNVTDSLPDVQAMIYQPV
jgi:hypothetical protein